MRTLFSFWGMDTGNGFRFDERKRLGFPFLSVVDEHVKLFLDDENHQEPRVFYRFSDRPLAVPRGVLLGFSVSGHYLCRLFSGFGDGRTH